jgi:site-specific recombinase XerD
VEKPVVLREAWERYLESHLIRKGRSPTTIDSYTDHVERLFVDWLDLPLHDLGSKPRMVAQRHDQLSKENGTYIANGAMRTLRAIYNHALKSYDELPQGNPTRAVDWNPEKRRNSGMGKKELGPWFRALFNLENPVRREFHLFTVLSGSRPTALKLARIEHLNFQERTLHIPRPKGGEDRAFDITLSRPMIRCLIRAMRYGRILHNEQADTWLFPSESESGHIVEQKEDRSKLSKWGNELRQTYRTIGQVAGISKLDIHLLMNHAIVGTNEGYITRDKLLNDLLRKQQERLSAMIVSCAPVDDMKVSTWLKSGKASIPATQATVGKLPATKSKDPYHAVRKARRHAAKLGLPMPSTRRWIGQVPGAVHYEPRKPRSVES